MTKARVKKYIGSLSEQQLRGMILETYEHWKPARKWLDFYADPDIDRLDEEYRKKIDGCFFRQGAARSRQDCRKALALAREFAMLCPEPTSVAAILLYALEQGMKAMLERKFHRGWRRGRPVNSYTGYVNIFSELLKHLESNDTVDYFQPQLRKLLRESDSVSQSLGDAMHEACNGIETAMDDSETC